MPDHFSLITSLGGKYRQNWGTMRLSKEMDHAFD